MIEFKNVSKSFSSQSVLKNLNLTIRDGEVFGILGPSGIGKSTLLKLINKLETPSSGIISIDGLNLNELNSKNMRTLRQSIGTVFQSYNLLEHLTVYENINLPLKLQGFVDDESVNELLAFTNLSSYKNQLAKSLSGGQKQRVAIARALVTKPKYLLCDEITSALDTQSSADIIELLSRANDVYKTTIVLVTHDLTVAKALCDRAAFLEDGTIREVLLVNKQVDIEGQDFYKNAKEVLMR